MGFQHHCWPWNLVVVRCSLSTGLRISIALYHIVSTCGDYYHPFSDAPQSSIVVHYIIFVHTIHIPRISPSNLVVNCFGSHHETMVKSPVKLFGSIPLRKYIKITLMVCLQKRINQKVNDQNDVILGFSWIKLSFFMVKSSKWVGFFGRFSLIIPSQSQDTSRTMNWKRWTGKMRRTRRNQWNFHGKMGLKPILNMRDYIRQEKIYHPGRINGYEWQFVSWIDIYLYIYIWLFIYIYINFHLIISRKTNGSHFTSISIIN